MKWSIIVLIAAAPLICYALSDDGEDSDYGRVRRTPFMLPSNFYNRRFQYFQDDQDDFERRRRAPVLASLDDDPYEDDEEVDADLMSLDDSEFEEDLMERKRRGSPYLYPRLYNLKKRMEGMKRLAAKKRSLLDSFTRDDAGNFGYDKRMAPLRRKKDVNLEQDKKRKKKSM